MGDVDAETGHTPVEPEAQDCIECVAHVLVPPVEVGLRGEELVQVVLAARLVEGPRRLARVERHRPVVRVTAVGFRVGPDVPIAMLGLARRLGVDEPGMTVTRVIRNEIEDHADAALRRLVDQRIGVGQGAERRIDVDVIRDVVTPVVVRRHHDRVEPDRVDAQPLEVVEALRDAPQITDAVGVRVHVGPRVDLVQHTVPPPRAPRSILRHLRHGAGRYPAAIPANSWQENVRLPPEFLPTVGRVSTRSGHPGCKLFATFRARGGRFCCNLFARNGVSWRRRRVRLRRMPTCGRTHRGGGAVRHGCRPR